MKILQLTREYPPHIYGGAGVHVEHLVRELAKLAEVEVRCFGEQNEEGGGTAPRVRGFGAWDAALEGLNEKLRKAMDPLSVGVAMASAPTETDVVHCHTWYSMAAGLWLKTMYGVPLVVTTHSLEPLRPWKADQLGQGGYALSSWIERTAVEAADAVIPVSEGTRKEVLDAYAVDPDRLRVIHNGVDMDVFQRRDPAPTLEKYGIPQDEPYLLFVGRITRQKGVLHLVEALRQVAPELRAVLCAGAPDTPEIAAEMEAAVTELQKEREGVFWVREMVAIEDLVRFYSGATLFVCPSIYEPFGIINLEAMACGCPVVASRVGGIPEAVADGETGILVPFEAREAPDFQPRDPASFASDLAAAVNELFRDRERRERMAVAGRQRVEKLFSWSRIAEQTLALYEQLVQERSKVRVEHST